MVREERDKYRALLVSGAFHLLLLALLSFTGIFAIVTVAEEKAPLDVTIYEETAGRQSGGGGGAAASPQAEAFAPGDIAAVSEKTALPAIHEEYTKSPAKQQEYKKEHGVVENASANGPAAGNGGGSSGDEHGGSGQGDGSGSGSGSGAGHGGDGGAGNGQGNARDPVTAARAAIAPVLQSRPAPVYPESLRVQNVEGTVVISIIVGTDGGVDSASVASSSGYGEMDGAALSAVRASRYTPAMNAYGEPVRFHKNIRIPFRLDG